MSDTSTDERPEERPEERPDVRPGARRDAGPHDLEVVVTQRELRNRSEEIMRGLEQGRRYLITSNGAPVRELTPRHRRHFTPRVLVAEEPGQDRNHGRRPLLFSAPGPRG